MVKVPLVLRVLLAGWTLAMTVACDRTSATKVSKGRSVSFDTGFPVLARFMGTFTDTAGVEHAYFAEPVSRKKLMLFSMDGVLERTVLLDSAVVRLGQVDGLAVVTADSLLLSAPRSGSIVCLGGDGRVKHIWKARPSTFIAPARYAENLSSLSGDFLFGDSWLFYADWTFPEVNGMVGTADDVRVAQVYHAERRRLPAMMKLCPSSLGIAEVTMSPDSFFVHLYGSDTLYETGGFFNYCHTANRFFLCPPYAAELIELDKNTMGIHRRIHLRSERSPICQRPVTVAESEADPQAYGRKFDDRGHLERIDQDVPSGTYVVQVSHAKHGQDPYDRPFSLLLLDDDLQQRGEHELSGLEHVIDRVLSTHQGLYIQRRTGDPRNTTVQVFDRFVFE